jgi:hypothetical protein
MYKLAVRAVCGVGLGFLGLMLFIAWDEWDYNKRYGNMYPTPLGKIG